jgi:rubrerythrin
MQPLTTDKEKEYKPTLIQCPRCTASGFSIHDDETHWKCFSCGHSREIKFKFKDSDIGPDQLKDTNGIPEE